MTGAARWLRIAAAVELVTLAALLGNRATVHLAGVASAVGPLHGTAYLMGIVLTWTAGFPARARVLAWIPGIGSWLAARSAAPTDPAGAR